MGLGADALASHLSGSPPPHFSPPNQLLLLFFTSVTETHQLAEANEKKNERLRAAFGISDSYVDGSSFDPNRRAKEAATAAAAKQQQEQQKQHR